MQKKETAAENMEAVAADIRAKVDEGTERFARNVTEMADFAKESSAAFTKSANATGRAVEKINAEVFALGAKSVNDSVELGRQAAEVKNFADLVQLQSTFANQVFEDVAAKLSSVGEIARDAADATVGFVTGRADAYATFLRKQAA